VEYALKVLHRRTENAGTSGWRGSRILRRALAGIDLPAPTVDGSAGYRIADFDLHMATRPDVLATASAYSPSLG
jgi:hypothetical protein